MQAWDIFRQKYGTRLDQSQVINWIWYDTQLYTSGTTTSLSFFQSLQSADRSNMEVAAVLAAPKAFIVRAIRTYIKSQAVVTVTAVPTASNDIARLINNSSCSFNIGNKNYGIWPTVALPGGGGVMSDSAGAGATAADNFLVTAMNGVPDPRAIYTLSQPLLIDPQINFNFVMTWAAAQTLTGNLDIMVMLDGELMRPVQ